MLNGKKIIEGRLNKGKFKKIKTGDLLNINNASNFLVVGKNKYKSFEEMIKKEGVENVIPDKPSVSEAVQVYYKFYNREDEDKFGVLALKVKKEQS